MVKATEVPEPTTTIQVVIRAMSEIGITTTITCEMVKENLTFTAHEATRETETTTTAAANTIIWTIIIVPGNESMATTIATLSRGTKATGNASLTVLYFAMNCIVFRIY